jgi:hypothetical protein
MKKIQISLSDDKYKELAKSAENKCMPINSLLMAYINLGITIDKRSSPYSARKITIITDTCEFDTIF